MKPILINITLGAILVFAGYFIGHHNSTQLQLASKIEKRVIIPKDNNFIHAPIPTAEKPHSTGDSTVSKAESNNMDIDVQLTDIDADVRLNALYFAWRNNQLDLHHKAIAKLASDDQDYQVQSFAQWIQETPVESDNIEMRQAHIQLTDHQNPDEQLRGSLMEDPFQFQQTNDQLNEAGSLHESVNLLTEEQQLEYIDELIGVQDDESVTALQELVENPNPTLQNAAIEGLIYLMEMRTGHFDMIVQSMNQNYVYMNNDQLERFNQLTQPEKDL